MVAEGHQLLLQRVLAAGQLLKLLRLLLLLTVAAVCCGLKTCKATNRHAAI
jgi:hypothetical protein